MQEVQGSSGADIAAQEALRPADVDKARFRTRRLPWVVEPEQIVLVPEGDIDRAGLYVRVMSSNGWEVALSSCGDTYTEGLAHAALIAAAPELLEALRPFAAFAEVLAARAAGPASLTPTEGPYCQIEKGGRFVTLNVEDFHAALAALTKATGAA